MVFVFLSNSNPLALGFELGKERGNCLCLPFRHRPACAGLCVGETIENILQNPECEEGRITPHSTLRIESNYSLTGSGYSTPKVSTVTFFMTWGVRGLSL